MAANISAFAQEGDGWRRVQSKNFQLVGDADEAGLRRTAAKLEQFRYVFAQLFPRMKFNSPIPTRVIVFRDKKTFDRFKPIEWAAGFFQPGEDVNYIVLSAEGGEAGNFHTIFHEYTHFLVDNSMGRSNIPPWFNEGIAEYYEQFLIENDRNVTLGAAHAENLQVLRRGELIPLETFFATDYYTLHKQTKESAQLFYAQSWALLHYLLEGGGNARRAQFDRFVESLMRGTKAKDAFQQEFQTDSATLEAELKKYIAQTNFSATVVPFKEKLVFGSDLQTSAVNDSEAKAFLGDLLYHTRRLEEAERFLSEALTLDANSSLANTSLGLVKMKQNKFAEAKIYLEKASLVDSQNYLAFYSYASVIIRESMTEFGFASNYEKADAEKIRVNLRRAIALNPNFAESYNLYAFVNIIRNEEIDESIAMIRKALEIAPGNQWYAMRLAELYMRKDDFSGARAMAQKIAQTASEDRLKVYAENSVRMINAFEAQFNYARNYRKRPDPEEVTEIPLSDEEIARRRERALIESLNITLRRANPNEKRFLGRLTNIECRTRQVIFSITADDGILRLETASLENLRLTSFEPEFVNAEFGCGAVKKDNFAVITYRPGAVDQSNIAGEIVAVEFVPKTFRFLGASK